MATTKEFISYFSEQTKCVGEIATRPMMGEYLLYYRGKLVGGIYDNGVLLKPTAVAKELLADAECRIPYEGAKQMLVFDDFENSEFFKQVLEATFFGLPEKKKK